MNWPLPGRTLAQDPPESFFSVHDPLPPALARSVRIVLGLPPLAQATSRTTGGAAAVPDTELPGRMQQHLRKATR
jgi:hypothetical protein